MGCFGGIILEGGLLWALFVSPWSAELCGETEWEVVRREKRKCRCASRDIGVCR